MAYRCRHDQIPLRRLLRKKQTPIEALLWARLRDNRLHGLSFRRQHGIGPFIVDFFCPKSQLAIEIDGSQHFTPAGKVYDEERTLYLTSLGIRVIRFSNAEVNKDVEAVLEAVLQASRFSPSERGGDSAARGGLSP